MNLRIITLKLHFIKVLYYFISIWSCQLNTHVHVLKYARDSAFTWMCICLTPLPPYFVFASFYSLTTFFITQQQKRNVCCSAVCTESKVLHTFHRAIKECRSYNPYKRWRTIMFLLTAVCVCLCSRLSAKYLLNH